MMDRVTSFPSYDLETSAAGTGGSGDFSGKLESAEQMCSPLQTCSASFNDWFPQTSVASRPERIGISHFETPGCSTASSFSEGDGYPFLDHRHSTDFDILEGQAGSSFGCMVSQIDPKYASPIPFTENLDEKYAQSSALIGNRLQSSGPESYPYTFIDVPYTDADVSSHNVTSTDSTICHSSEIISDVDDHFSAMQHYVNTGDTIFDGQKSFNFRNFPSNKETATNTKDDVFSTEKACSSGRMVLNAEGGTGKGSVSEEVPVIDFDVKGQEFRCADRKYVSPICRNSHSNMDITPVEGNGSVQPFSYSHSHFSSKKQSGGGNSFPYKASRHPFTGLSPSLLSQKPVINAKEENEDMIFESKRARHCQEISDGSSARSSIDGGHLNLNFYDARQYFPCSQPSMLSRKQLDCTKDEIEAETKPRSMASHMSKLSPESIQSNSSDGKSHVDDDPDICILEDISQPAPPTNSLVLGKTLNINQPARSSHPVAFGKPTVSSQQYHCIDPSNYPGVPQTGFGGMRLRASDERLIFQVALQDLSQPKSEASLPDGVLTVPLLRHQRIALSWMVQKETSSLHCSGGILADDQGLGKTISTIALILKERPPSFRTEDVSKCEMETLNLDDDEDDNNGTNDLNHMKQESDHFQVMSNGSSAKSFNSANHAKGRPAAGTLVVCPTSVLRQWAEELRNKVTSEGSLSVLVYHGSNRTKDPCELAKYDVVITTYSIVSMEVPKQPLVDKEGDEEKIKTEGDDFPSMYCSSGKKRKYPPSSDKKGLKHKKGADGLLLEIVSGPLAKVGWFRVVLDEAQSIKNHRTQVARACWGLRAKRRWCLSGTPIQNAIDDLYSYFRFLRYDPFAVYKSFCSTIKVPISKNPVKGYKKLQAVLKTIMLRRTKGTLLDGEPIINLPPKEIKLKQVEFTDEERQFYNQLEIDSRDQFKEYAAAGTVKQNYVNILLMLLRLRQACDHPLLVKGFDSNSLLRSSVEMANKLPREKQIYLLNCLEASLALCGICNDPPEDAVVSVCGHVFCNQCICERLTGDDNQCPTTNCKVRLSVSLVFSKATLNTSLLQQPGQDSSIDCSVSKIEEVEPSSDGLWYNSSKIKAALEVLQSLSKPRGHTLMNCSSQISSNDSPGCPGDPRDLCAGDSLNGIPDEKKLITEKYLNDSIKVGGEKAIVFSQWTKMLDLLEACLKDSSIQYRRLDGTMSVVARDKAVKDFNTLPEVSVMIMSLKAASLGLNMVAACHVLLLDLWWNPTTEDQAIDRAHRIGQTRPVTVLRLTVRNTVEDRILALQQKKREMVASAFGEDESGGQQTRLTVDDLNYLFMV
ncbi:Helicase-like transcription factor CHR28 [Melia azedarach]|nr:Helicase-like transcription factor CHR28 [Melia azedarach]